MYFHFINELCELCDVHGVASFTLHLGTGPVILLSFSVSGKCPQTCYIIYLTVFFPFEIAFHIAQTDLEYASS